MKRCIMIFFTLILVIVQMPMITATEVKNQEASTSSPRDVLVIYDQLAVDTVYRNNLSAVETLLSALSQTAEIVSMDDYRGGRLLAYQKVIVLKNTQNTINNPALIADCQNYSGAMVYIGFAAPELVPGLVVFPVNRQLGRTVSLNLNGLAMNSIWVDELRVIDAVSDSGEVTVGVGTASYPFAKTSGKLTYVPTFIGDPEFSLALGEVLKGWFGRINSAHMTLLIPDIYPFSDLNMVIRTADTFYANGIPFALGVVPIDDNMDYPAMARFYQVLRYVQSRNGTILIHRPSPATVSDSSSVLSEKMYAVIAKLVENGVYPLGLVTDDSLFFDAVDAVNPLNLFSSGIILPDTSIAAVGPKASWALSSVSLGVTLETVINSSSQNRNFGNYPINTTIVMELPENQEVLTAQLNTLNQKWLSLSNYQQLDNQWTIGQNTVVSSPAGIRVNGLPVPLVYDEEPISDAYAYQKPPEYSLEKIFTAGNAFLLTVVGIIIVVFIIIVLFSRRVYLNKFRKVVDQDNQSVKEKDTKEDKAP